LFASIEKAANDREKRLEDGQLVMKEHEPEVSEKKTNIATVVL